MIDVDLTHLKRPQTLNSLAQAMHAGIRAKLIADGKTEPEWGGLSEEQREAFRGIVRHAANQSRKK